MSTNAFNLQSHLIEIGAKLMINQYALSGSDNAIYHAPQNGQVNYSYSLNSTGAANGAIFGISGSQFVGSPYSSSNGTQSYLSGINVSFSGCYNFTYIYDDSSPDYHISIIHATPNNEEDYAFCWFAAQDFASATNNTDPRNNSMILTGVFRTVNTVDGTFVPSDPVVNVSQFPPLLTDLRQITPPSGYTRLLLSNGNEGVRPVTAFSPKTEGAQYFDLMMSSVLAPYKYVANRRYSEFAATTDSYYKKIYDLVNNAMIDVAEFFTGEVFAKPIGVNGVDDSCDGGAGDNCSLGFGAPIGAGNADTFNTDDGLDYIVNNFRGNGDVRWRIARSNSDVLSNPYYAVIQSLPFVDDRYIEPTLFFSYQSSDSTSNDDGSFIWGSHYAFGDQINPVYEGRWIVTSVKTSPDNANELTFNNFYPNLIQIFGDQLIMEFPVGTTTNTGLMVQTFPY